MNNSARLLADYYLQCAGIAAIEIGAGGEVTVRESVTTEASAGCVSIVCLRGDLERLAGLAHQCCGDQAAVARRLRQLAAGLYIGITPHRVVVDRALAAVDAVNGTVRQMQEIGGMREVNRAFKAARTETPSLRYQDHMEALKLKLIQGMAADT